MVLIKDSYKLLTFMPHKTERCKGLGVKILFSKQFPLLNVRGLLEDYLKSFLVKMLCDHVFFLQTESVSTKAVLPSDRSSCCCGYYWRHNLFRYQ